MQREILLKYDLKTNKPIRLAYKILVGRKLKKPVDSQRKWVTDGMLIVNKILIGREFTKQLFVFYIFIFSH